MVNRSVYESYLAIEIKHFVLVLVELITINKYLLCEVKNFNSYHRFIFNLNA